MTRRSRTRFGPTRRRLLGAGWRLAALALPFAAAAAEPRLEDSVKAAYLFQFVGYVEWPPQAFATPDGPLVIGVAGADGVLAELRSLVVGRQAHGRSVVARAVDGPESADGVQVLFVGRDGPSLRAPWLQALRTQPVLLVTEQPEGAPADAVLNLVLVNGRIRFEASVGAAERAGLRLSSRLLAVAERVRSGAP